MLQRGGPPVFDAAVELSSQSGWQVHEDLAQSVDSILSGKPLTPTFAGSSGVRNSTATTATSYLQVPAQEASPQEDSLVPPLVQCLSPEMIARIEAGAGFALSFDGGTPSATKTGKPLATAAAAAVLSKLTTGPLRLSAKSLRRVATRDGGCKATWSWQLDTDASADVAESLALLGGLEMILADHALQLQASCAALVVQGDSLVAIELTKRFLKEPEAVDAGHETHSFLEQAVQKACQKAALKVQALQNSGIQIALLWRPRRLNHMAHRAVQKAKEGTIASNAMSKDMQESLPKPAADMNELYSLLCRTILSYIASEALLSETQQHRLEAIAALLKQGADPNGLGEHGSCLHLVVKCCYSLGNESPSLSLTQLGVSQFTSCRSGSNQSRKKANSNCCYVWRLLVEAGASLTIEHQGLTPLQLAESYEVAYVTETPGSYSQEELDFIRKCQQGTD
ncbi:unnamed protein product [Polarella glacialis]|uniref:Uncharacterized protein n=1 Tax=Polarella glacialis TaxID=89957 RepID=A0A813LQP9_POLGL|nr:unnamed protein product [Polarella glacialis]